MIYFMKIGIFEEISRNLAREVFPETGRGRTLSKMTADAFNTNTGTVHTVGLIALATLGILVASRR